MGGQAIVQVEICEGKIKQKKTEADGEALYSSASSPQVCFQVLMPRIYNYFNPHDIDRLDIYPHWNVEDSAFRYEDTINKVALRRLSESHRDRWKNAKTFLTGNKIKRALYRGKGSCIHDTIKIL